MTAGHDSEGVVHFPGFCQFSSITHVSSLPTAMFSMIDLSPSLLHGASAVLSAAL